MAWIDTGGVTRNEPFIQVKGSWNNHACVSVAQRRPLDQPFKCHSSPLQPPVSASPLPVHQPLQTPFSCEKVRLPRSCSLSVGGDSFKTVNVTGASISCGLWKSIPHLCRSGINVLGFSDKNQEAAFCCTAPRSSSRSCSLGHNLAQSRKRSSRSFIRGHEGKVFCENGREELGESPSMECRASIWREREDQRLTETRTRKEDRLSVFSWWCCCSRAVALARGSQRGSDSCRVPSKSGRKKKLHFFVSIARRNFWVPLQKIATRPAIMDDNPPCKGGGHLKHSSAMPRDASTWSSAAILPDQQNEKATRTQHRPVHAYGNVLENSNSGHFSLWRRSSDNTPFADNIPLAVYAALTTATNVHLLSTWCKLLGDVNPTDRYQRWMDVESAGLLGERCGTSDIESGFLLSLFLKRVCDLLEVITFVARLLRQSDLLQKRRQPQPTEVIQMTLLGVIEIALLALQEPSGDSSQLHNAEKGDQQQLFLEREGNNGVAGIWSGKQERSAWRERCTGVSGPRFDGRESTSDRSVDLLCMYDKPRCGSKDEDVSVKSIRNDFNNSSDQQRVDPESALLLEILSLKKEASRLEKNIEEKRRKLVKAMARRHRLLIYTTRAIKLTGEYHRRRRLLSQLESPIRRMALLRGYGRRCPCLYHNELARRAASAPVAVEGRSWHPKTALRGKNLGLDTQPVGYANQVFHSALRKAQASFRPMYDRQMGRNCHATVHQGASREHKAAQKDSGSDALLGSRESKSRSRSPSLSCQQSRMPGSLERKLPGSPRSNEFDFSKKSEDAPELQKNHKAMQSLLNETSGIIEEYMEKDVEDGLPHDFVSSYDLKHIGRHSVMPPLNAAAEKQNGWKQRRMLFFIESLIDRISDGDTSEEQAASLVVPIVSLVEQTKVEQCDLKIHCFAERLRALVLLLSSPASLDLDNAKLKNLLPGTYRACRAAKAVTAGTFLGKDQSKGREPSFETLSGSQTPVELRSLPASLVTSTASIGPAGTGDAVIYPSECGKDSVLREKSEGDECGKPRTLESRLQLSTLAIPSTPIEARPDAGLHANVASLQSSTTEHLHRLHASGSGNERSDALNSRVCKDPRSEWRPEGSPVVCKMYPRLVGHLSILCPQEQTDTGNDCGKINNDAMSALLLLPASGSKQCGASLRERINRACRVGLASVIEEEGIADCRAQSSLPGSLAAGQWISCCIGVLYDSVPDEFADLGSIKSVSTTNLTPLPTFPPARFAADPHETRGAGRFAEEGPGGTGVETSSRIRADDVNSTNSQRTPCGESVDKTACSIMPDGYTAGSLRKKFSLLGRVSPGRMSPTEIEKTTNEMDSVSKPNEPQNPFEVGSLPPSHPGTEHPVLPHGPQEPSGDYIRSASAGQHRTASAYESAEEKNTPERHRNVRESTTLPAGVAREERMHSHSICTERLQEAPAEPPLTECQRSVAQVAFGVDHSLTTTSLETVNGGGVDGSQHFVESSPPSAVNGISQEVRKEQDAGKSPSVMESKVVMDDDTRGRSCKTSVSDSNCVKHRNEVHICSEDCSDIHLQRKEGEALPQNAPPSDGVFGPALQRNEDKEASPAVAARDEKGSKKLTRKKRKVKTKRKSFAPSTKKTGTDHKEKVQKTRSRLQDKSSGTLSKGVNGYADAVKHSSQNVKKRSDGQKKGVTAQKGTSRKSQK